MAIRQAARRAVAAGVDSTEIHGAHGFLIHQFHSAFTNKRTDQHGQDLTLFGTEVVKALKTEIPADIPLIMRISAVQYVKNGYKLPESFKTAETYHKAGIDIFHISSGGEGPIEKNGSKPENDEACPVPFTAAFKNHFPKTPVIAVGLLSDFHVANAVIANQTADLVTVGRGML